MRSRVYKNIVRAVLSIALLFVVTESFSMVISLAKLKDQLSVLKVERVEVKGFTLIEIVVRVDNRSRFDVEMSDAGAIIHHGEREIATVKQVEVAVTHASSQESILTRWRIEAVDATNLLLLASRISKDDYSDLTLDYTSKLSVGRFSKTMSDEGVAINEFLTTFAK